MENFIFYLYPESCIFIWNNFLKAILGITNYTKPLDFDRPVINSDYNFVLIIKGKDYLCTDFLRTYFVVKY
jgi:hypothetical protein